MAKKNNLERVQMGKNNDYGYGVLTNTDVGQIEYSLKLLVDGFKKEKNVNLLEIGIKDGSTSRQVKKKIEELGLTNYTYWGLDNGSRSGKLKKPFDKCKLIIGDSEESFHLVPHNLHWVFIDGCHCANHVMLDFLNYGQRVKKGGFLMFHDTGQTSQGNHYQQHGPCSADFHIAVERAFKKLDIFNRSDWAYVSSDCDPNREFGGVTIFQKISDSEQFYEYKSKNGQDKWALDILDNKENGYFVDIGAADGTKYNNTYVMEKEFKWDGICVEPNPNTRAFPSLVENRSCICDNVCIYNYEGEVDFVARGRKISQSGVYKEDSNAVIKYMVEQKGHPLIKVPCITLFQLLEKNNAPKVIDYLNIDTEGSEWEILKDFDFSKYKFLTVTVKNNYSNESESVEKVKRNKIRNLLDENGYILMQEEEWGEDYFKYNISKGN